MVSDAVERPDTDDYDLLTYGEAAARLAELIIEERRTLEALKATEPVDKGAVRRLEERVALLESSDARYKREALTSAAFIERFGFQPFVKEDG